MSAREPDCLTCGGPIHTTTTSGDTFCVPCSSANERGWTEGYDRALLERDAAEVDRAIDWFESLGRGADAIAGGHESMRMWERRIADCQAWLTRARVALA